MDSFCVLNFNCIIWCNMIGSGNEIVGYLVEVNWIMFMWCGFEKVLMILWVYGMVWMLYLRDVDFEGFNIDFLFLSGVC